MKDIIVVIVSYLLGCFNTGYYYTRIFYHKDIRNMGTNVTGAMNVSRLAGKKGFFITFLGDALKGVLVVLLCRVLRVNELAVLLSVLAVILGHIFPFQLKFKGGKGMSTVLGALLTFHPVMVLILLADCAVFLIFSRRYTISSLFALAVFPIELIAMRYPWDTIIILTLCSVAIIFACRDNLREFYYEVRKKFERKSLSNYLLRPVHFLNRPSKSERHGYKNANKNREEGRKDHK